MFAGKIEGSYREKLLQHMSCLYREGYICLLQCPSLEKVMSAVIYTNTSITLQHIRCQHVFALWEPLAKIVTMRLYNVTNSDILNCVALHVIFSNAKDALVEFISMIRLCQELTRLCVSDLCNALTLGGRNKFHYRTFAQSMRVVKRCRTDSVCHYLQQAVLCYNAGKYSQCLDLVRRAKMALSVPSSMHIHWLCNPQDNTLIRKLCADRRPVDNIIKKSLIGVFIADNRGIPELYIEAHGRSQSYAVNDIYIPPLIFAFFLHYLCYRKLGLWHEGEEVLSELSLIVEHDDGRHIYPDFRAASWEILGVCQQMHGDNHAACRSYLMALRQDVNFFKIASCIRLGTVLAEYF